MTAMNSRFLPLAICTAAFLPWVGCQPPGKPTTADIELKPEEGRDFATLYQQNCAGCHGQDGKGNTALALANPVYLAIASDDTIRRVTASGVHGSLMPAFAKSSFLALVSDQDLRTTVIAGRPDLGHPDWRNYVSNKPMTPQEVTDVVAWLVAQRNANPGQPYRTNQHAQM